MKFGSVCSGIEAASVAWHPLGWRAAWLAEIEPFPSAVLAHHYPDVPNIGDMTKLLDLIPRSQVEAPDVFCGGTPCQAFSVAGLRKSLGDARGNLSLTFCEIANAIDTVRVARGDQPAIVFWENVPGVLSTADNAFGCFLAGLAGEDDPLVPPGGKWSNAGCVFGPQRTVAWRVLDAQYFGVAQRRRRVFVVASARKGFDPAAVLFEFDGVRRDSAPSREAREVAPTIPARSLGGGGLGSDFDCDGGVITMAHGQGGAEIARERSPTLTCNHEAPIAAYPATTHTLRGEGFDASEDGTGRGTPLVPVAFAIQAGALRTNPLSGPDGVGVQADHAYTLEAKAEVQAVCFDTTQITSAANYSNPKPGDPCHPLAAGAHAPAIAFSSKDYGNDATADLSPTVRAMGHAGSHQNGGGQMAVAFHPSQDPISSTDGTTHAMGCGSSTGQASIAVAVALRGREGGGTAELGDEVQNCLRASSGGGDKPHVLTAMQVRRLTPRECERLQGFPDDYTAIPWRTYQEAARKGASYEGLLQSRGMTLRGPSLEECPDGPRYKALGNSWAVPNVRWIGRRIAAQLAKTDAQSEYDSAQTRADA